MKVKKTEVDNIAILSVDGSIDSSTAAAFQKEILAQIEIDNNLILDLSKNDFISSAGLRVLLLVYRSSKVAVGKLIIVGASDEIKDVMYHTGFSKFFTFSGNIEEGIQMIKSPQH
ncbi:MAG: STAS domain-containing protein [Saprospiraceae bacterium]|nr:STAS domain-containing protein [Saprospiraceae bacterium]